VVPDDQTFCFVARADVVASNLPGGMALLDLQAGKYFSLNAVGAEIWKLIQTPVDLSFVVTGIVDKFDVQPDVCATDVQTLITSLVSAGLVEVSNVKAVEAIG
jgi:hypothetical protein